MMSEYPNNCRQCQKIVSEDNSIFWNPSISQWFRFEDLVPKEFSKREIDLTKVLVFCPKCYIEKTLYDYNAIKCDNCGVFDNYRGYACMIRSYKLKIRGNMAIGNFEFVSEETRPAHLKTNGRLCEQCRQLLLNLNIIRQHVPKEKPKKFIEHDKSPAMVQCHICEALYPPIFNEWIDQGDNCASTITEQGIYCSYGSDFDMNKYAWISGTMSKEYHELYKHNKKNICDSCITKLCETNVIKLESQDNI